MREERRSGRSVVLDLRDEILSHLRAANVRPGEKIPTEAQLCDRFGTSRPTIREALKLLEQDGVIVVKHGRGRYLTAAGTLHVDRPITTFESITEMALHNGYDLDVKVLSVQEESAPSHVASALRLSREAKVIRLERLRLLGREPVVYSVDYIRRDVIEHRTFDIDWAGSLLDILERYHVRPTMSAATVRAELLPVDVIARYDLSDFGPALTIEETTYTLSGDAVNHAVDYHRGSHFAFSFLRK